MSQLPKVGQNLRRLRNGLGLSLDEASKLTGVSKAMLGQIERGESSPTISTLWKISSGLKVNFISLLDDNRNQLVLVKKDEIHPIKEENGKMIIYPIFPFTITSPLVGVISSDSIFSTVDLPEPDGPSSDSISPWLS